jgi:hypothetical protein
METKRHTWRTRQEIEVCHDCIYVSANGLPKADEIISAEIKLHAERYAEGLKQWGDEPYGDEEEPSFSWRSCDFCGEKLGGHRYTASLMQLHEEESGS